MEGTPTPPPENATVTTTEGTSVIIEQGPRWLVELLYAPPAWVRPVAGLIFVSVVGLAALSYHRNGIDEVIIEEISANGIIAISCLGLTTLLVRHGDFSYALDVVVGGFGGYAIAQAAIVAIKRATK